MMFLASLDDGMVGVGGGVVLLCMLFRRELGTYGFRVLSVGRYSYMRSVDVCP